MKKISIIIILIIVLIIIGGVYFMLKTQNYDSSKEVNLGISGHVDIFEECINDSSGQIDCGDVSVEDLDKLRLLSNQKGIIECDSYSANGQGETYGKCLAMIEDCNQIFSIKYIDRGMVESSSHYFSLYLCNDKQYYVLSRSVPPALRIAQVQISEETINKLKE
jgi:hypothetical protein